MTVTPASQPRCRTPQRCLTLGKVSTRLCLSFLYYEMKIGAPQPSVRIWFTLRDWHIVLCVQQCF